MAVSYDNAPPGAKPALFTGGMDAGQETPLRMKDIPVTNGRGLMRVRLSSRTDPDLTLASRSFPMEVDYTPLGIDVVRPCYRNSIYATEDLKEIVADVRIQLPDEQLAGRVRERVEPGLVELLALAQAPHPRSARAATPRPAADRLPDRPARRGE